jgi:hypothetical protein
VADGAALLASAIRAAVLAKAPRRTVQAVAAAVCGVLWRPTVEARPHFDVSEETRIPDDVRASRLGQRQRKKERRRAAAADKSCAGGRDAADRDLGAGGTLGHLGAVGGREGTFEHDGPAPSDDADTNMVLASSDSVRDVVLQSDTVRATSSTSAPAKKQRLFVEADAPRAEIDDLWADSQKVEAAVCDDNQATRRLGAARRVKIQENLENLLRYQAKLLKDQNVGAGAGSVWAAANLEKVRELQVLLGLTDPQLAGVIWPPPKVLKY